MKDEMVERMKCAARKACAGMDERIPNAIVEAALQSCNYAGLVADNAKAVEAAFREGYDDGWCTGTAAMEEDRAWNLDADWERSEARAALQPSDTARLSTEPAQD